MTPTESGARAAATLVVTRRRGWAGPVTALAAALLGVLLLLAESPAQRLVGGLCAAGFGVAAVLLATRRVRRAPAPALVLDENGFTDAASGTAAGFVPWSAVTGLRQQQVRGQRYLSVLVAEPAAVLARADGAARAAMRANLVLLGTPVNIPVRPLAIEVAELTLAFVRHTPAALTAALTARLPAEAAPRLPAADADLADLARRAAAAGITLPGGYLDLLAEQDGWSGTGLLVYGSRPTPDLDGVLEATRAARAQGLPDDHVLLGQDDAFRYTWHTVSADFPVLARSDHRPLTSVSTFSDLIVAALEDFRHPLG